MADSRKLIVADSGQSADANQCAALSSRGQAAASQQTKRNHPEPTGANSSQLGAVAISGKAGF